MVAEPEWRTAFLQAHGLFADYLVSAQKWFNPMAGVILEHHNGASRPYLVAVNGSQGSGKSTLCDYLRALFSREFGLRCIALSLDDFYLTSARRRQLGETVHPLLQTRGVPGTHDMALLLATLEDLAAGRATAVPRFDKAEDDRRPREAWEQVSEPVDIVLLEGWCLGAVAQAEGELAEPVNALEAREDVDGRWRKYVNTALATQFPPVYQLLDEWVMLRAPSFDSVYRWRLEQEQKLAARRTGQGVMDAQQVARFIQFYQRLTGHCLETLPARVNHLYTLDGNRRILSYTRTPGAAV